MKSPLPNIGKLFLSICQRSMGTAKLQSERASDVLKGIVGRILQSMAMTYLPMPSSLRVFLQRMKGIKIGKKVFIGPGCFLDSTRPNLLEIEDHVALAGRITILTHYSPSEPIRNILGPSSIVFKKVTLKRGAVVGVNCIILPGITAGENCMISAGSVVSKNVPPHTIVSGNPARVIGRIEPPSGQEIRNENDTRKE